MKSGDPPEFDKGITVDRNGHSGKYSCPICDEFSADSVRKVKGHISGSRDEEHADLGWNFDSEIRETADE